MSEPKRHKDFIEPVGGTCCACGNTGKEEKICPVRSERGNGPDSCCNHWWDGTDEDYPSEDQS